MPRPAACLLPVFLAAVLVLPGPASARVAVVAAGTPEALLVDVTTNAVVARTALPGAARAVAVAPDGRRAYVAAGDAVAALDLSVVPGVALAPASPAPGGVAPAAPGGGALLTARSLGAPAAGVATGGGRVVATAGRSLLVLGPGSLRVARRIGLRGIGGPVALGASGRLAAVVLAGGRVALVDAGAGRLLRRVRVPDARGVAVDAAGRAWVTTSRGRLYAVAPGARRAGRPLRLGAGLGAGAALSPDGGVLAVGAAPGGDAAALVDLRARRVRRLRSGRGPGVPAATTATRAEAGPGNTTTAARNTGKRHAAGRGTPEGSR